MTVVAELALTHPATLVPVKVYVVLLVGDTVKLVPVNAPGFKVYVFAPVGVITVEPLEQIVGLLTDKTETVGVQGPIKIFGQFPE